jgi:hypothetical protein
MTILVGIRSLLAPLHLELEYSWEGLGLAKSVIPRWLLQAGCAWGRATRSFDNEGRKA